MYKAVVFDIGQTLVKYNTRVNTRDYEVNSDMIFKGIMECFDKPNEAERKGNFVGYVIRMWHME